MMSKDVETQALAKDVMLLIDASYRALIDTKAQNEWKKLIHQHFFEKKKRYEAKPDITRQLTDLLRIKGVHISDAKSCEEAVYAIGELKKISPAFKTLMSTATANEIMSFSLAVKLFKPCTIERIEKVAYALGCQNCLYRK